MDEPILLTPAPAPGNEEQRVSAPTLSELHRIAAQLLDLSEDEFGADDNLIECGLQSIQMINLAARLRRSGIEVVFADLALNPTVRGWSTVLRAQVDAENAIATDMRERLGSDVGESDRPADPDERFGLATMQHAYWIGRRDDQQLGGVAAHLYAEFDGPEPGGTSLDPDRVRRAVDRLVDRHEMLRAVFDDDGRQYVPTAQQVPVFEVNDLRTWEAADIDAELERLRDEKTHQRMPAERGKVTDVTLTLLPSGRHRLHVDIDMLAADALSYRIMMADLAEIHRGRGDELAPIDYSYRRYLSDKPGKVRAAYDRDKSWWADQLGALPDPPTLPIVPEHDRADPHRTIRCNHWIDADAKRNLIERSHGYGVTPAVVLAAVFAHVVASWSRDSQFLLNVPLFDREPTHDDVGLLSGDFSSSVMLAVDGSHRGFLALIRDVQRRLHTYASHSAYPGLDVLRDLGRHRGGQLLAPVVYTSGLDLGELFAPVVGQQFGRPAWIVSQGPQVVLDAQVVELDGGLLTNWDVREQAFPAGVVDAMFARHRGVIDRLLGTDANWDFDLGEPAPAAQLEARRAANAGAGERAAGDRVIHDGFFRHAATTPDAVAIVDEHGNEHTYANVSARALRIAGSLRAHGVETGDIVAVRIPKGADQIVIVLAILALGAAYLPVGRDQPPHRVRRMYDTAGVRIEIADTELDSEPGAPARVSPADLSIGGTDTIDPVNVDPSSLAYVMFTSGSTGEPKGVELTHDAVSNTLAAMNTHFGVDAADRSIALSALEFDLSVQETLGLFAVGGSTVAVTDDVRRDGHAAAELVRRHRVTQLYCVPAVLDVTITGGEQVVGWADSVKVVILGGDWVRPELLRRMHVVAPSARLAGLGGATETSIHHTICEVDGGAIPTTWQSIPFGVPFAGTATRVVNDRGQDCPDWVPGELWVGGAGLARGYRGDPERTAQRFVEHDGMRWYRTGDTARYWPDGTVEFLGRRDHQVKIRGFRVELGEVEAALRALDYVADAVATTAGGRLVAAVATVTPADAPADKIVQDLSKWLPPYMIPSTIDVTDEFPRTSNGKIDRTEIGRRLAAHIDNPSYVEPATPLETVIASMFGEVVGRERVGADDEFFDIGGDSVLATSLVGALRDVLQSDSITVSDVFGARTPAALARRLETAAPDPERLKDVAAVFVEVLAMSDEELEQFDRLTDANETVVAE